MKNSLPQIFFLATAMTSITLSEAATIQFTDSLPTADVFASNTASTAANIQVRNIGGTPTSNNRWVGVGFQALTSTSLDKMTFFIYNDIASPGALGASMTFSIVSLSGLTASPSAPFTPLYSESGTVPLSYGGENYMTFDLATPFSLTSGGYYGVIIGFDSNASDRGINLTQSSSGSGGNTTTGLGNLFFTSDQGLTYTNTSGPINFVAQTIPEPSVAGLLILGGAAYLFVRRRRTAMGAC